MSPGFSITGRSTTRLSNFPVKILALNNFQFERIKGEASLTRQDFDHNWQVISVFEGKLMQVVQLVLIKVKSLVGSSSSTSFNQHLR